MASDSVRGISWKDFVAGGFMMLGEAFATILELVGVWPALDVWGVGPQGRGWSFFRGRNSGCGILICGVYSFSTVGVELVCLCYHYCVNCFCM